MKKKMRVTQHNGRSRKSGEPYSVKHNDRNFDVSKASNIDPARVADNLYWSVASGGWYADADRAGKPTFEDVERDFYEAHFMPMYKASKARSEKRGQGKRVSPFEKWRQAKQFRPEETTLQIGEMGNTVDARTLAACVEQYIAVMQAWNRQHGEPFTILDMALHLDEATPHLQMRRVWHSVDPETGVDEIGQAKALERAGVALPDPKAEVDADNNRKMTYDAYMREKWLDICEAHGLDIERIPEKGRKHNQTKEEYIEQKQKARAAALDEREAALDKREAAILAAEQEAAARVQRIKADQQTEAGKLVKLKSAREGLQNALQGDLRDMEAQEAKQGATVLLAALGASVRPPVALDADGRKAVRDGISSAMERMTRMNRENEARWAASGPTTVDGPTM